MLCRFSFDDMLSVTRPIDDMLLSYADVILELAMIKDGVLAFTGSYFSTADTCSFIDFLILIFFDIATINFITSVAIDKYAVF